MARNDVVVLPSVPVIPTTASSALGSRYHHAAAVASAARVSATTSCGRSLSGSAWSTSAADAPARGRRSDEVVPVGVQPGDGDEERARRERRASRGSTPRTAIAARPAAPIARPSSRAPRRRPSAVRRAISPPSSTGSVGSAAARRSAIGRLGHRPIIRAARLGQAADLVAARVEDAFVRAGQLQPLSAERLLVLVEPVERIAFVRLACGRRRRPRRRGPSRCFPRGSRAGSRASAGGAARPGASSGRASWSPEWTVDRRPPWRYRIRPASGSPRASPRAPRDRRGGPRARAADHQATNDVARTEREMAPLPGLEEQIVEAVEGDLGGLGRGERSPPLPRPVGAGVVADDTRSRRARRRGSAGGSTWRSPRRRPSRRHRRRAAARSGDATAGSPRSGGTRRPRSRGGTRSPRRGPRGPRRRHRSRRPRGGRPRATSARRRVPSASASTGPGPRGT